MWRDRVPCGSALPGPPWDRPGRPSRRHAAPGRRRRSGRGAGPPAHRGRDRREPRHRARDRQALRRGRLAHRHLLAATVRQGALPLGGRPRGSCPRSTSATAMKLADAVAEIRGRLGGAPLDALVNNAGISPKGPTGRAAQLPDHAGHALDGRVPRQFPRAAAARAWPVRGTEGGARARSSTSRRWSVRACIPRRHGLRDLEGGTLGADTRNGG